MDWFARIWIPIAIAVTGVAAMVFVSVQQVYRQSLNDPQVQIAEDVALQIENGAKPATVLASTTKINIASSLRTYTAVYDKDFNALVWTGELDGKPPSPPLGVFSEAKGPGGTGPGENRVTWQPNDDVRSAIVVVHVLKTDGYVLSGRNMREAEDRIWDTQFFVFLMWIFTLATTLFATWIGSRIAAGKTGVVW